MIIKYEIEQKNDSVLLRRIEDDKMIDEIELPVSCFNLIKSLFFDTYTEIVLLKRKDETNR